MRSLDPFVGEFFGGKRLKPAGLRQRTYRERE